MSLEQFKETLRQLCMMAEDLAIENSVYFDAIVESGSINFLTLKQRVTDAQADPAKRKETHEMYSEMWAALEKFGVAAFGEDLLANLPPTHRPN